MSDLQLTAILFLCVIGGVGLLCGLVMLVHLGFDRGERWARWSLAAIGAGVFVFLILAAIGVFG